MEINMWQDLLNSRVENMFRIDDDHLSILPLGMWTINKAMMTFWKVDLDGYWKIFTEKHDHINYKGFHFDHCPYKDWLYGLCAVLDPSHRCLQFFALSTKHEYCHAYDADVRLTFSKLSFVKLCCRQLSRVMTPRTSGSPSSQDTQLILNY